MTPLFPVMGFVTFPAKDFAFFQFGTERCRGRGKGGNTVCPRGFISMVEFYIFGRTASLTLKSLSPFYKGGMQFFIMPFLTGRLTGSISMILRPMCCISFGAKSWVFDAFSKPFHDPSILGKPVFWVQSAFSLPFTGVSPACLEVFTPPCTLISPTSVSMFASPFARIFSTCLKFFVWHVEYIMRPSFCGRQA